MDVLEVEGRLALLQMTEDVFIFFRTSRSHSFCWGPDILQILLRGGIGSSFSRLSNGTFINDVWV